MRLPTREERAFKTTRRLQPTQGARVEQEPEEEIDGLVPMPNLKKRRKRRPSFPTTPAAIERYRKVKIAMDLRASGMGYREIAEKLGYKSPSSIHQAILKWMRLEINEDAAALRQRELHTLDLMQKSLMEQVIGGTKMAPRAAEVVVKLMERRAALLGLDVAEKHEVEIKGPQVVEYFRDDRQETHRAALADVLKGTLIEADYTEVTDDHSPQLPALPAAGPPDPSP